MALFVALLFCRPCGNSGAKLADPTFVELSPVFSDQQQANHKNSV
jgi:hypothetical protein